MKRLLLALFVIGFCLQTQYAHCQVKNDFSDWNVPPPVPAGTIPKGPGGAKKTVVQIPPDVPAPNLQLIDLKLAAMSPILRTATDVPAPGQPQFPPLPFAVPDIPLPQAPAPMDLPKQTPHDEITEGNTDMPEPAAPEVPEFPKIPDVSQKSTDQGTMKFPVIPAIVAQPGAAELPADAFPFLEWPLPCIPENSEVIITPSGNSNDDKVKPTNKRKTAKKIKGG